MLPTKLSDAHIEHVRDNIDARLASFSTRSAESLEAEANKIHDFLESFAATFSVSMAMKMSGMSHPTLRRLKNSSYDFCTAYNDIVDSWAEQVHSSAIQRARGYLRSDENTESGFVEDASGVPIYFGADSGLTKTVLKAIYPDQYGDKVKQELTGANGGPIDQQHRVQVEFITAPTQEDDNER